MQVCWLTAGNGSTTLVLEIYYNQQRNWLKACTGRTLVFWATVGATDVVQPIQVNCPPTSLWIWPIGQVPAHRNWSLNKQSLRAQRKTNSGIGPEGILLLHGCFNKAMA